VSVGQRSRFHQRPKGVTCCGERPLAEQELEPVVDSAVVAAQHCVLLARLAYSQGVSFGPGSRLILGQGLAHRVAITTVVMAAPIGMMVAEFSSLRD
jgi:hypothetical protein